MGVRRMDRWTNGPGGGSWKQLAQKAEGSEAMLSSASLEKVGSRSTRMRMALRIRGGCLTKAGQLERLFFEVNDQVTEHRTVIVTRESSEAIS